MDAVLNFFNSFWVWMTPGVQALVFAAPAGAVVIAWAAIRTFFLRTRVDHAAEWRARVEYGVAKSSSDDSKDREIGAAVLMKLRDPQRPWVLLPPKELRELLQAYKEEINKVKHPAKAIRVKSKLEKKEAKKQKNEPKVGSAPLTSEQPMNSQATMQPSQKDSAGNELNDTLSIDAETSLGENAEAEKERFEHDTVEYEAEQAAIENFLAKRVEQAFDEEEAAIIRALIEAKSSFGPRLKEYWTYHLSMRSRWKISPQEREMLSLIAEAFSERDVLKFTATTGDGSPSPQSGSKIERQDGEGNGNGKES